MVDHHNLASCDEELQSSVVEVIDHRPQDPRWSWKEISKVTIQNVGSCCTLVAQKIKEKNPHLMTEEIAKLLLGLFVTTCFISYLGTQEVQLISDVVGRKNSSGKLSHVGEDSMIFGNYRNLFHLSETELN